MTDEQIQIRADAACEVARQTLLRLGGFICAHETEINDATLHHVGACDGCPVVEAEKLHESASGMICRLERWFKQ